MLKAASVILATVLIVAPLANAADTFPPNPQYKIDTAFPKFPFPSTWTIGLTGGVFVGAHDHHFICRARSEIPRPSTAVMMALKAASGLAAAQRRPARRTNPKV